MSSSRLGRYKGALVTIVVALVAFVAGVGIYPSVVHVQPSATTVFVQPTTSTEFVTPTTTVLLYSSATSQVTQAEWLPATNQVISWTDASNYVGQYVTVQGTIVYTYFSTYSDTTFLDFNYPYQGYFYAVIFSSDLGNFNFQPVSFYLNKEVRVTGTIQIYNGSPEIIVSSPSQIEVAYMGFSYP